MGDSRRARPTCCGRASTWRFGSLASNRQGNRQLGEDTGGCAINAEYEHLVDKADEHWNKHEDDAAGGDRRAVYDLDGSRIGRGSVPGQRSVPASAWNLCAVRRRWRMCAEVASRCLKRVSQPRCRSG